MESFERLGLFPWGGGLRVLTAWVETVGDSRDDLPTHGLLLPAIRNLDLNSFLLLWQCNFRVDLAETTLTIG